MTIGLKRKGARITTQVRQKTEMNSRIGRPAIELVRVGYVYFCGDIVIWQSNVPGIGRVNICWNEQMAQPSPSCSCGITVNLPLLVGWTSNSCFFVFPEEKKWSGTEFIRLNPNVEAELRAKKQQYLKKEHHQ